MTKKRVFYIWICQCEIFGFKTELIKQNLHSNKIYDGKFAKQNKVLIKWGINLLCIFRCIVLNTISLNSRIKSFKQGSIRFIIFP